MVLPFRVCACSHGLLSFVGDLGPHSIDLSNTTKLKDVVFQPDLRSLEWMTTALQTITPNHELREISIRVAYYSSFARTSTGDNAGQTGGGPWHCPGLDRLLIQLWESRSIRLKVIYTEPGVAGYIGRLLPEMTGRGLIDLVEDNSD